LQGVREKLRELDGDLEKAGRRGDLSSGEFHRRQGLLDALKNDADAAEKQLAALGTAASLAYSPQSLSRDATASSELFSGSRARILGAPRETEQTLGAENSDILVLQKTLLAKQDTQLHSFSQTLARQRELGTLIGQELEEQTELLDDLGTAVGETSAKMNRASRKTQRFH
jgi:regulator of vacuolar morphogenesis